MATPEASYAEMLSLADTKDTGFALRGVSITNRLVSADGRIVTLTLTRLSRTWTVIYLRSTPPSGFAVGRIIKVLTNSGEVWRRDHASVNTDGWVRD